MPPRYITTIGTLPLPHAMTLPPSKLEVTFGATVAHIRVRDAQSQKELAKLSWEKKLFKWFKWHQHTNGPVGARCWCPLPFLERFFVRITLPLIVIQIGLVFLFLHTACMVIWYALQWHLGYMEIHFHWELLKSYQGSRGENALFSPVDVRLLLSQCRWQKSRKSRGFFSSFLILLS